MMDQITELDEKLLQLITLVKKIDKRVLVLEKVAAEKGFLVHNPESSQEDACVIM